MADFTTDEARRVADRFPVHRLVGRRFAVLPQSVRKIGDSVGVVILLTLGVFGSDCIDHDVRCRERRNSRFVRSKCYVFDVGVRKIVRALDVVEARRVDSPELRGGIPLWLCRNFAPVALFSVRLVSN